MGPYIPIMYLISVDQHCNIKRNVKICVLGSAWKYINLFNVSSIHIYTACNELTKAAVSQQSASQPVSREFARCQIPSTRGNL